MFKIEKEFTFSASHQLTHLPTVHQCARLHGHNYRVVIMLESFTLDRSGFVVDYGDLSKFKKFLDKTLDHRHLNDVFGSAEWTTAERLALYLFQFAKNRWNQVVEVRVSETDKTWASFHNDGAISVGMFTGMNPAAVRFLSPENDPEWEYPDSFKRDNLSHLAPIVAIGKGFKVYPSVPNDGIRGLRYLLVDEADQVYLHGEVVGKVTDRLKLEYLWDEFSTVEQFAWDHLPANLMAVRSPWSPAEELYRIPVKDWERLHQNQVVADAGVAVQVIPGSIGAAKLDIQEQLQDIQSTLMDLPVDMAALVETIEAAAAKRGVLPTELDVKEIQDIIQQMIQDRTDKHE